MEQAYRNLIEHLAEDGVIHTPAVRRAFERVDRKDFVPKEYKDEAYRDVALSIGFGQTISQPYTVAFMLEHLEPRPGQKVLDVGAGSGWTTALLAESVGPDGQVYGVEIVPELVQMGKENLAKYDFTNAEITEATRGTLGLPGSAPYDRILVSARSGRGVPRELLEQLKVDGRMIIPDGNALVRVFRTRAGEIDVERFEGFLFVPLVV